MRRRCLRFAIPLSPPQYARGNLVVTASNQSNTLLFDVLLHEKCLSVCDSPLVGVVSPKNECVPRALCVLCQKASIPNEDIVLISVLPSVRCAKGRNGRNGT
jgi:hypothetical protein